jgi:hypothetical protein
MYLYGITLNFNYHTLYTYEKRMSKINSPHPRTQILKDLPQFKDPSLNDGSNKYIGHFTQLIGTYKIEVGWPVIFTLNFVKSTGVVVAWVRWTNTPT